MSIKPVVVAIDGPAGSGKSSVSRGVASNLGMAYLDTGAMFRALAWYCLEADLDINDPGAVEEAAKRPVVSSMTDPLAPAVWVDGRDVSVAIRGEAVTAAVSLVAAVPAVRARLLELQRAEAEKALASGVGIVVEGRDIGSVVFPEAAAKIYLTADPAVRAARRALEDAARESSSDSDVAATQAALAERDRLDKSRATAPLKRADGAIEVDASYLNLAEVIAVVEEIVRGAATA